MTVVLIYPCDPLTTITPNNRGFTVLLKSDDYDFQKYGHKIFFIFMNKLYNGLNVILTIQNTLLFFFTK